MNPIYLGDGILEQIKKPYYYDTVITKKGVFDSWMNLYKEFYKQYPYALKWDYESFIREILDYYG